MVNFNAAMEKDLKPIDTIDGAKSAILQYKRRIDDWQDTVKELEVTDAESNTLAVEMAGQVKKLAKQIESKRKEIVKEPDTFVRSVNAFARPFKTDLANIERLLKVKINGYQTKQLAEQRERERKEAEARAKLQEQINAETKPGETPIEVPRAVAPAENATTTRTTEGTASIRKTWAWELENIDEVPRQYLILDKVSINKAVRAGVREIAGIKIFEKHETIIRT